MFADTMQAIKDREMELAKSESSMIMTSRMYARYIIEKDKKYEDEVTKRANEILHDSSYSRIDGHSRLIQHKLKQQTSNPVQGKYKSDKRTRHKWGEKYGIWKIGQ